LNIANGKPIPPAPTLSHRVGLSVVGFQLVESKSPVKAWPSLEKYPGEGIRTKKKLLNAHLSRKRSPVGVAQPPPKDCQGSKQCEMQPISNVLQ
jgi:hypothetical protein